MKCLSKGELLDYDTPYNLINNKKSILYDLVHSLGEDESKELIQIACNVDKMKKNIENVCLTKSL